MFKYTPENDDYISPSSCLEETFYILSKKNAVYRVKLSEKGLCLQKEYGGNVKTETIQLEDIIGCRCMRSKRFNQKCVWHPRTKYLSVADDEGDNCPSTDWDESDVSAYLYLYAYVFKKKKRRERVVITLRFRSFDRYEDNLREANKWKTSVHFLINARLEKTFPSCFFSSPGQFQIDNKVLFILNPKSGVGKSKRIFQNKVVPLLTEADINYDVYVTKYSLDAKNMIRTQNLWQYMGGIVAIGGDGIVSEVLNGILTRPDWKTLITQIKLGILPAGSGNGLAKSISYADNEPYDQNPILVSTLNVVRGFSTPLDVVRVETKDQVMYSFLSIGWGMISDVDIESERLRALGSPRFTLWAIAKIAGMKSYKGVVSYLPSRKAGKYQKLSHSPAGHGHSDNKNAESSDDEGRRDSFYSAGSRRSIYLSVAGSSYESLADDVIVNDSLADGGGGSSEYGPSSRIPPLGSPLPPEWVVLKGEFLMVHASYPTHIANDTIFAPNAKLNDGCMWLIIIRSSVTRAQLIQMLLGLSTGTHTSVTGLEYLPVTALRIEPDEPENGRPCGLLTVDGELVPTAPVQAEVITHTVQVFSRR